MIIYTENPSNADNAYILKLEAIVAQLKSELIIANGKSEQRREALEYAYHIIIEDGTPQMRAHAILIEKIRRALQP